MSNKLDETLAGVAEDTIMSLAFLFLMSEDEAGGIEADASVTASVEFSGPFAGALFLSAPQPMLDELAANMLGFEQGEAGLPSDDVKNDALKELLNVICGNLLPEIAGNEAVFKVHAPQIQPESAIPETYRDQHQAGAAKFYVEEGALELVVFVDNHALV
ncbi:MAG: chemotaxis protein CheX [Phycisphaerae bacterium]